MMGEVNSPLACNNFHLLFVFFPCEQLKNKRLIKMWVRHFPPPPPINPRMPHQYLLFILSMPDVKAIAARYMSLSLSLPPPFSLETSASHLCQENQVMLLRILWNSLVHCSLSSAIILQSCVLKGAPGDNRTPETLCHFCPTLPQVKIGRRERCHMDGWRTSWQEG